MYFLLLLFAISTAFACQSDSISVVRRTGISVGSNGRHSGNASLKINIPVQYNGKWGCWEQEGGLSFDVKDKSRTMTIIVPKSEFENIPARSTSYALIRKNNSNEVQIDISTFVCLGSTVLATESFSGSIFDAMILQNMNASVSTVFATGIAAENLSRQKKDMALTGGLEEYFMNNFTGNFSELEKYDVMVPSVYLGANMRTPLSKLSANFQTRVLTKSACSPEFENVMAPLRFENLRLPEGMKAKVKKGDLQIRW